MAAFGALVERYQRRAVSASYRLVGNIQDAMEVSQDAFLRAYRSLGSLNEPARFGPWLMRIVSNLSLNFRRSRRSALRVGGLPLDDVLSDEESAPAAREEAVAGGEWSVDGLASGEVRSRIEKAIAELPEKQRLALILFAIEGWPQRDVAEVLGCSLEAVKWNVFQARKTLKEKLAAYL
ncbi:MAG: RNA polymerase sigma factor [Phycisphaerae bacterium]